MRGERVGGCIAMRELRWRFYSQTERLQRNDIWDRCHALVDCEDFVTGADLYFHRVGSKTTTRRFLGATGCHIEQSKYRLSLCFGHDKLEWKQAWPFIIGIQRRAKRVDRFLIGCISHRQALCDSVSICQKRALLSARTTQ